MQLRSRPIHLALIAVVAVALGGYAWAHRSRPEWVRVTRDENYDIWLDRARTQSVRLAIYGVWRDGVEVWYRTDHAQPRMHDDKTFNREIVHALVWCDSLRFKVMSVDMSMGDGRVVARERSLGDDLKRQRWRKVEQGTSEEVAAIAACHFGRLPTATASRDGR